MPIGNVRTGEFIFDVTAYVMAKTTLLAATQEITAVVDPPWAQFAVIRGFKAGLTLTGNVVVHGTDGADLEVSDTIALNDDNIVTGDQAFKTITSVDLPVRVTAGDQVSVGVVMAPAQLPTIQCREVYIKALSTNGGLAYVSGGPTASGCEMDASEVVNVETPDLHQLWAYGAYGEGITYLAIA
jgi:hypothetical protein